MSALYYSFSVDQGESWSENTKLSGAFDPHLGWPQQDKMGDYFDMESDEEGVHLAWANTFNGEQDVYYARIVPQFVAVDDGNRPPLSLSCYPNPVRDQTTIRYTIHHSTPVTLEVLDISGQLVKRFSQASTSPGMGSLTLNLESLQAGYYLVRLTAGYQQETIQLVKVR